MLVPGGTYNKSRFRDPKNVSLIYQQEDKPVKVQIQKRHAESWS
jgi:hypothetical protein